MPPPEPPSRNHAAHTPDQPPQPHPTRRACMSARSPPRCRHPTGRPDRATAPDSGARNHAAHPTPPLRPLRHSDHSATPTTPTAPVPPRRHPPAPTRLTPARAVAAAAHRVTRGADAAARGAAVSVEIPHNADTLHRTEIKQPLCVRNFHAMQGFHVNSRRAAPERDKKDYSERVRAARCGATFRSTRPPTTRARTGRRAGRACVAGGQESGPWCSNAARCQR